MLRTSNKRQSLIQSLSTSIPEAQTQTHAVDEAAAARLKINRTDLRCLGVILQEENISAGNLAKRVGLTRGAMTTALDRLEMARYVHRVDDPADRRSVQIEATAAAKKAVAEIWQPITLAGLQLLEKYSDRELALLARFFEEYSALQRTHAERIRLRRRANER